MPDPGLSVVIPVYNSEKTIGKLVERLESLLSARFGLEIILVNDYSLDRTMDVLRSICDIYDNVTVLSLSRNFGQHNAIMAGLNYARGTYVVTMDDDLQHRAEDILRMFDEIEKGYDVVYGQYRVKHHSFSKNLGSELNNVMGNVIIEKPADLRFTSFRIMRSYVVREMIKYDAPYPYVDGLILRATRNIGTIPIEHQDRLAGRSSYTLKKMTRLWLNGFMNFSIKPLRLFTYLGFLFAGIGFISAIFILVNTLFFMTPIEGWTSLIVATLIFSGVQLLSIGMVGEYVGRIFLTQNKTPQYVIKERMGGAGAIIASDDMSQGLCDQKRM